MLRFVRRPSEPAAAIGLMNCYSGSRACSRKPQCCPDNQKRGRSVTQPEEGSVVMAFRKKMASEEARKQYRRRG